MQSASQCARPSASRTDAATVLICCTAADATLPCGFSSLPLPVELHIFALLPADARARAAAVCQAWRQVLTAGPSAWQLWTELDLSETSGVTRARSDAALEGAAALARGRLRTLKLRDFDGEEDPHDFTYQALLRVVTANAGLEELTYSLINDERPAYMTVAGVQKLLAAGPALQHLTTDMATNVVAAARALLRREPPYAAVRLHDFLISGESAASPLRSAAGVIAFATDVAACESLRGLTLDYANLEAPAALAALVDAVLPLTFCCLRKCTFASAVALPQLARLFADSRMMLKRLFIENSPTLFANVQEADIAALRDALAQSTTLEELNLTDVGLQPGAHMPMAMLLRYVLASRPGGSVDAEVTVQ